MKMREKRHEPYLNTRELACEHDWEEISGMGYNEVRCTKCHVYGAIESDSDGDYVYYPAT